MQSFERVLAVDEQKKPNTVPLFSLLDLGLLFGIPLMAVLALLLPPKNWYGFAYAIGPFISGMMPRGRRDLLRVMRKFTGNRTLSMSIEEATRRLAAAEVVSKFQNVRDFLPMGWQPQVALEGIEHIEKGLAAGRGVILWDSHFHFASLMTKFAMHRVGHPVVHLSQPGHGFSKTRFGMRIFNPLRTKSESHYIAERIVLSLRSPTGAMRTLIKRLKQNAVVSITVRPTAVQPIEAPFMNGFYTIATGAPDLAYRCGATLLPVFTVRMDNGDYKVIIDPPLDLIMGASRHESAVSVTHEYARRLELYVCAHPDQWIEWFKL